MFKNFRFTSFKFLAGSALFFGLASAINLFAPLDLAVSALSNKVRLHDASGDIVIVSLDDYAAQQGFSTPLSAERAEDIFRTLLEAKAQSIVLSVPVIKDPSNATSELEQLLIENSTSIFITEPTTNKANDGSLDHGNYVSSSIAVNSDVHTRYWGGVEQIAYARNINGEKVIAAGSAITGVYGKTNEFFAIDYSIDIKSLPFIAYDPEQSDKLENIVSGNHVVLGYETAANSIMIRVLGHGGYFGVPTVIALGAETLKQGRPKKIGWIWAFCLALFVAYYILGSRNAKWQSFTFVTTLMALFSLTVILANAGITTNIGSAICLVLFVTPFGIFRTLRESETKESSIHPDSGLPSLNALRLVSKTDRPLVVARIAEFDELMGLLSPEERKTLAVRISSLATPDSELWHGEDGHFYWFIRPEQAENLADHLESFGLILRNGFSVGNFPVSLKTVFGVDLRFDANLSDRILGANLSAKRAAGTGKLWLTYEEADKDEAAWSLTRLRELDLAIRAGQIRADLQPKIDLRTGQITGVEALARWTHPIRGAIRPDEFVEAAEDGGRIKELTIAVMHSAFASVRSAVLDNPDFAVSVNITPSLLMDITLCHTISALLAQYQIAPSNLILEITESTAFTNNEVCMDSMHELVAMGITLSIDDYGTGNSTLDYLKKIPARELKIDRQFVSDIMTSSEDSMLVQSTIKLAHELNMLVVAEGVEDTQTLEKLRSMDCDLVQGYLISRPLSSENFIQFMSNLRGTKKRMNNRT